jgi:hypothetical protein
MKKAIQQIIIFFSPIILMAYPIDIFLSKQLSKSNSYAIGEFPTWNSIYTGKINSKILIYGSSRAWVQIDPNLIANKLNRTAYNLGIDGYTFWIEHLRHRLLLKYNTKPALIIYSVDIFSFVNSRELYNTEQFLPYMLYDKDIPNYVKGFKGYKYLDSELPLVRYCGNTEAMLTALKMFVQPKTDSLKRIRGYEGQDRSWNDDLTSAKEKLNSYVVKVDTPTLHLFEHFLNECKTRNINVMMVYSPEYIDGQKFVKNRSEIMKLYKKISSDYKVPFYDYSSDTLCFNKKYFYNSEHLNKLGSKKFTEKIIQQVKNSFFTKDSHIPF